MKNKKLSKVFAAAMAGGVIITSFAFVSASAATTTTAVAATTKSASSVVSNNNRPKPPKMNDVDRAEQMKTAVAKFVTDNTITQAESDSITTFLTANKTAVKVDMFTDLVTNKILTQEKADALKAYLDSQRVLKETQELTTAVSKFVTDKTITQAQADQVITALTAAETARKAAFDKAATMNAADRKTYLDGLKATEVNPLTGLVTNGTITQAQADKIGPALHFGFGEGGGRGHGGPGGPGGPGGCGRGQEAPKA